jgi:FAD/FMN-containing dehydrogenase/Fe-S oxidoreductase
VDLSILQARLRDDLRRQFHGELLLDPASRALYSTDASLFQIAPLAVALPRDEDDLRFLVRYAYDRSIPLAPRGAGTGIAGESLGHGIVVDLSAHFRSILATGDDWVRVQPGVVLDQLNQELAKRGRRFAPDPASSRSCTIGGMIATNASGGRAAIHGYTAEHVLDLRVIWDDGTADWVGFANSAEPAERTVAIRTAMRELLATNADLIESTPRKTRFDRCGYALQETLRAGRRDLLRLLIGSEGTLAVTAEAKLRTIPIPGGRSAILLGFPSFDAALYAGLRLRETSPAACELLDRRLLSLARTQDFDVASAITPTVEAALLIEYERETQADADELVQSLLSYSQDVHRSAELVIPAFESADVDGLLALRAAALPSLYALGRGRRPLAFVEDIGVAPETLPEFITRAKGILKRADLSASFQIHMLTGQVHLRPFADPDDPDDAATLWPLAEDLHGLAIALGGTVSAQHGTGIARTPWVSRQFGPLFPVFRELKRVFDPRNILNPGKIVGPDPSRPAWPLRTVTHAVGRDMTPTEGKGDEPGLRKSTPLLVWAPDEMATAVAACNGCGACRTEDTAQRMCPTFRATHSERAAPRAKANLFRSLLEGGLADATDDDLRAVAELCVNCKMCATECPGNANIPKLMLEAKAANHAALGWRRSMWFLAKIEGLASLGSKFALTSNFLLRRPSVRWAVERFFGLARHRTLHAFSFRTFLGRARQRGLTKRPPSGPGVAYFVDTFANLFDPSLGEATVAVLRHNGIAAYVPPKQRGSGAMALAQGDLDVARERLASNIRRLADCARDGLTIVCSEPTAALFFRLDALDLSDDPDVRLVAEHTVEVTSFLWSLHQKGKLRTDFQPVNVAIGHHVPCHIKAIGQGVHGPDLLSLIPGLSVSKIDVSCSGMAGTYGLNAKNLATSLEAGRPMLEEFSRPIHRYGSSECSACRMQMQEGTGKRSLHPVQYLALAYGLMPSIADRLRRPLGRLVTK